MLIGFFIQSTKTRKSISNHMMMACLSDSTAGKMMPMKVVFKGSNNISSIFIYLLAYLNLLLLQSAASIDLILTFPKAGTFH